jgi:DNA-binding PadR family transcriptional regulator
MLDEMEKDGLISKKIVGNNQFEIMSFSITKKGEEKLIKNGEMKDVINQIVLIKKHFKGKPLDELLMNIYKKNPEFTTKSELVEYKYEY